MYFSDLYHFCHCQLQVLRAISVCTRSKSNFHDLFKNNTYRLIIFGCIVSDTHHNSFGELSSFNDKTRLKMVKTLGSDSFEIQGDLTLFWELPLSPSPILDSSILHLYCLKTTSVG